MLQVKSGTRSATANGSWPSTPLKQQLLQTALTTRILPALTLLTTLTVQLLMATLRATANQQITTATAQTTITATAQILAQATLPATAQALAHQTLLATAQTLAHQTLPATAQALLLQLPLHHLKKQLSLGSQARKAAAHTLPQTVTTTASTN